MTEMKYTTLHISLVFLGESTDEHKTRNWAVYWPYNQLLGHIAYSDVEERYLYFPEMDAPINAAQMREIVQVVLLENRSHQYHLRQEKARANNEPVPFEVPITGPTSGALIGYAPILQHHDGTVEFVGPSRLATPEEKALHGDRTTQ